MTTRTRARRLAPTVALTLIALGCGGNSDSAASQGESAPPASADTSAPGTSLATASAPTDVASDTTATTTPPEPGAPRLASVLSNERVGLGWEVPAGTWVSDAFLRPIEFDTPVPLTLIGEYGDAVVFANPARPDSKNRLYIVNSSFIHNGDNRAPVPLAPEDVSLAIDRLEHVTLIASSIDDTESPWWELSVGNFANGAPYGCELGDFCGPLSFTRAQVPINSLEGERARFYRAQVGDDQISVHVTGEPEGFDDLIEIAESIVTSLRSATGESPATELRSFGILPTNGATSEPGSYVARYPSATLRFDIDELPTGMSVRLNMPNTIWIASSRVGIGFVPTNRFIDPAADQTLMHDITETEYRYVAPITTEEAYLDWVTAMEGTPTEVDAAVIGGLPAISVIDSDDDRTVVPRPCSTSDAHDADGECITTWTSDNQAWWSPVSSREDEDETDDDTGRTFFVADAGLLITVAALDDTPISEALDLVQPLLDSLAITISG